MGCRDGWPSDVCEHVMSRWLDVLDAARELPFESRAVVRSAVLEQMPHEVRLSMTWCRWSYRAQ